MGLLDIFSKAERAEVNKLPSGSFTVDSTGKILASTLPQKFSKDILRDIGDNVLATFRGARQADVVFAELNIAYADFRITARELRGGAIVFLKPEAPSNNPTL
jgi:hypothetical protein